MINKMQPIAGYFCDIEDSRMTNTSTQFKVQKKLTLESFRSAKSFDSLQNEEKIESIQTQRKLFATYLRMTNRPKRRSEQFAKMKYFYCNLVKNSKIKNSTNHSIPVTQNLMEETATLNEEVMLHFILIWLKSMNYKSEKNLCYILQKIQLTVPKDKINQAIRFYDDLGHRNMTNLQRLAMLEDVCRNGWQIFFTYMQKYVCSTPI